MFQAKNTILWALLSVFLLGFSQKTFACGNAFEEEMLLSSETLFQENFINPPTEVILSHLWILLGACICALLPFWAYHFLFRVQRGENHPDWLRMLFSLPWILSLFFGLAGFLTIVGSMGAVFLFHSSESKLICLGIFLSLFGILLLAFLRSSRESKQKSFLKISLLPLSAEFLIAAVVNLL